MARRRRSRSYSRRSSTGGSKGMTKTGLMIASAMYGAVRAPVTNLLFSNPTMQKLPFGRWNNEVAFGIPAVIGMWATNKRNGKAMQAGNTFLTAVTQQELASAFEVGIAKATQGKSTSGNNPNIQVFG